MTDDLITADELAQRLRVRPSTVQQWAREGRIPRIRISGTVIRFDFDAVRRALAAAEAKR